MGLALQVPIDMVFSEIFGDDMESTYVATGVYYDPADYNGVVAVYFQATFNNAFDTDYPISIKIVDELGTEYATATILNANGANDYERTRSSSSPIEFVPDVVPRTYMVKTLGSGAGFNEYPDIYDAKILVEQVNASKTKIHIPLITGDASTGGLTGNEAENDKSLWSLTSPGTTYNYGSPGSSSLTPFPGWHNKIKVEKTKFATIDHWELEVVANTNYFTPTGNSFAALFNVTTGQMVAGTELTFASGLGPTSQRVSFASDAANFTEGDEVAVHFKGASNGNNEQMAISLASLNVVLTNATKALVYHRLSNNIGGRSSALSNVIATYVRYLHEPTKFSIGTLFYHEICGLIKEGAGCNVHACDMIEADSGKPLAEVSAANVAISSGKLWVNETKNPLLGNDLDGDELQVQDGHNAILYITDNGTLGGTADLTEVGNTNPCRIMASGFSFSLPPTAVISQLFVNVVHAQVHIGFTDGSFITCTTPFPLSTSISGTTYKAILNGNVLSVTQSPQNNTVSGSCGSYTIQLIGHNFDFTSLGLTAGDLNSESFTLELQGTFPTGVPISTSVMVAHHFDFVSIRAGYGIDVSTLSVDTAGLTRLRSAALNTLVDGNRYVTRYESTDDDNIFHANNFIIAEVVGVLLAFGAIECGINEFDLSTNVGF